MSRATAILKIAALSAVDVANYAGAGVRGAKKLIHGLGDAGEIAGHALGVNPELARAGAQVAGVGGALYAGNAVKDQTNQKIQEMKYRLQYGNQGY